MLHAIFDFFAHILLSLGHAVGMDYETLGVYLFVFLWPAATVTMLAVIVRQQLTLKRLQRR